MDTTTHQALADELYAALRSAQSVAPITERHPDCTIRDAYAISRRILTRRVADGETVIGRKIGVTSAVVQQKLGVEQPDFGWLTDAMLVPDGGEIALDGAMIHPRAEGEVAFGIGRPLRGPGVTAADVIAATDWIAPCIEVVDSRIEDWRIRIEDTIADNASCGFLVLGPEVAPADAFDLRTIGLTFEKNGAITATGAGAASMNSPAAAVAWLANRISEFDPGLRAGDIVIPGSLVPLEPVVAGDHVAIRLGGVGSASVRFV